MQNSHRRRSMIIAASGTIVEWFDFSLFFYLTTSLSLNFYPGMENSLLFVLATGAVGFIFRPLGAIVFGHIGDTHGRTAALVISAALMSIAMLGIGIMPGHSQIGIWGGLGVLALRALAGFSVGAEYTGIMVYLMETAKPNRRGFAASWAAANSEVGALLAVGSAAITTAILGNDGLHEWGWRIPFIVGALLAAGMIPLRKYMVESPVMATQLSQAHAISAHTDSQLTQANIRPRTESPLRFALQHQRRAILGSFLISTVGSATYFLTITYLPTYIETIQSVDSQKALNYGVIAALVAIVVTPFIGLASDLFGRWQTFLTLIVSVVSLTISGYWLLGSADMTVTVVAVALLAVPAAGWSAVAASAVPELFDDRGRFSGMALGYNAATVIFGGLTPSFVSWLMNATGSALAPAFYAALIALVAGIPAIYLLRSTRH